MDKRGLTLQLLPLAAAYADVPVSRFHVGAIAWGGTGALYLGANLELPGQPLGQTCHAEQAAINHAWLSGETQLVGITINASPCGHCRQFMNETRTPDQLTIHLPEADHSLTTLLPFAFGPNDLGIRDCLLEPQTHELAAQTSHSDLMQAALMAASQSYAPYTQSFAGIALKLNAGRILTGRYAENAAFNPGLPPLQSALSLLRMQGEDRQSIQAIALAEHADGLIQHKAATEALAHALGLPTVEYVAARLSRDRI